MNWSRSFQLKHLGNGEQWERWRLALECLGCFKSSTIVFFLSESEIMKNNLPKSPVLNTISGYRFSKAPFPMTHHLLKRTLHVLWNHLIIILHFKSLRRNFGELFGLKPELKKKTQFAGPKFRTELKGAISVGGHKGVKCSLAQKRHEGP